ncbi:MAG: ParB/RepB/Spo0J family partition protein [Burkholderiales bacterium]|nr:ParB/RepB/Spo0J family partition protein [Burkholderiales bacterium]
MRLPWHKPNQQQLELLSDALMADCGQLAPPARATSVQRQVKGRPVTVPIELIDEDPANPRAEFSDAELDDLAADIRLRGILVPLVVHPADDQGRYRLHFGARRLRAAVRAGLEGVPVVVRDAPSDRYAQVAENLKRADLAPLDLARFIRQQMDAGDSQAQVSRRLSMNLTTVAHYLSLLNLPPVLAGALKSGRCASPRTLHELSTLHEREPERVEALVAAPGDITRVAVSNLRAALETRRSSPSYRLIGQAIATCDRLEKLLARIGPSVGTDDRAALADLHAKVSALSAWTPPGSDGQTP